MVEAMEVAAGTIVPEWPLLWFWGQPLETDIFLPILSMLVSTQMTSLTVREKDESGRIVQLVPSQTHPICLEYMHLGLFNTSQPSTAHSAHSKSRIHRHPPNAWDKCRRLSDHWKPNSSSHLPLYSWLYFLFFFIFFKLQAFFFSHKK